MIKLIDCTKEIDESENLRQEKTVKIAFTSRNLNRNKTNTVKILVDSLGLRSLSSKNFSLMSRISSEKLKISPIKASLLPKLKKITQFQKPSRKDLKKVSDLLRILPVKFNYPFNSLKLIKPLGYENKKTLILDLDETLTHTQKSFEESHVKLWVTDKIQICVNIRPYAQDLLKFASQFFEVIVFTASHFKYANTILDHLDPLKRYIHHRVYRENCVEFQRHFIKDLRIFADRNLKDTIIVDNSLVSFALQIENGVPISKWTDDLKDEELKKLIDYLQLAKNTYDIRTLNRDSFNLKCLISELMKESEA